MAAAIWRMCHWVLLLSSLLLVSLAINVDVKSATVYDYEEGSDVNLFGVVVGQVDKWLLIGAPRDMGRKGTGSLFVCKPGKAKSCKRMPYHKEAVYWSITIVDETDTSIKYTPEFESSEEYQPRMICLRPSYLKSKVLGHDMKFIDGGCWITSYCNATDDKQGKGKITPKSLCSKDVSAALLEHSSRQLLMANPGNWIDRDPTLMIHQRENGQILANLPIGALKLPRESFSGLSSAIMDFDGDGRKDYVVGLPFNDEKGSVAVFDESLNLLGTLTPREDVTTFGWVVIVTDLNGDGMDDLVVGAPDWRAYTRSPTGRVYIYYHTPTGYSDDHLDVVTLDDHGRFGDAIAAIGDINKDGYNDLCIANHEYNLNTASGKVAIYHGSNQGLILEPAQEIYGSDFKPKVWKFGMSISSGVDQDGNSYPDIVVGGMSKAVYLRSRPIVRSYLSVNVAQDVLDLDEKDCTTKEGKGVACFVVHVCYRHDYTNGKKLAFNLEVSLDKLVVSRRVIFEASGEPVVKESSVLAADKNRCSSFTALYQGDPNEDTFEPIEVNAILRLDPKTSSNTKVLLPVMKDAEVSAQVRMQINCGADDICVPDLYVNGSLNFYDPKQMGSDPQLKVTVGNDAETALNIMLYITLEHDCWSLSTFDDIMCGHYETDKTLACKLPVMLYRNEVTMTFSLEPRRFVGQSKCRGNLYAPIKLQVSSDESEGMETLADNTYYVHSLPDPSLETTMAGNAMDDIENTTSLQMLDDVRIILSGNVLPPSIKENFKGTMQHRFVVTNGGGSTLRQTPFHIVWPAMDDRGFPVFKLEGTPFIEGSRTCKVVLRECPSYHNATRELGESEAYVGHPNNCTVIECLINQLYPGDTVTITIHSKFNIEDFFSVYSGLDDQTIKTYSVMVTAVVVPELNDGYNEGAFALVTKLRRPSSTSNSSVAVSSSVFITLLTAILVAMTTWAR